jgi:hypothetical protein
MKNKMKKKVWKYKELKDGDKVNYDTIRPTYGRMEYRVCFKTDKKGIKEIYMYPNRETNIAYKIVCENPPMYVMPIGISAPGGQEIKNPNVWSYVYCKEHKNICARIYVPDNTDCFEMDLSCGDVILSFQKDKKDKV